MKIVLAWIQWSWKWTQWKILEKKYNFKIFDTGGRIREIAREDTDLWREIKQKIDCGNLVSIDILSSIVNNFLSNQKKDTNIIFDWVPRNLDQKVFFDTTIWDFKIIYLNLPKSEAENRVIGRKICFSCQSTFSKKYEHKFCDVCGGKIWVRVDDSDDGALQKRIDIFVSETIPVIDAYRKEGKVIDIDATWDIADISIQIETALWLSSINRYRIRELEANEKDTQDLKELYKIFGEWYEVSQKNVYLMNKSSRDFLLWYELDNKIVWTLSVSICLNAGKNPYAMIENFCVLESYRELWIARALLEEAQNKAKMFDCYKIVLLSNRRHTDFHKMYTKFWFENETSFWFKKYL
jgi:adenylate kinase family enzyme